MQASDEILIKGGTMVILLKLRDYQDADIVRDEHGTPNPTTILGPTGSLWAPVSDDGIDRRGGSGVESIPRAQWPFQCLIVSTAAPFLIII
jgi:hypothetical protein